MRRNRLVILSLFFIASCTTNQKDKSDDRILDTLSSLKQDTIHDIAIPEKSEEKIVSNEFLDLVKYIDSCGYLYDTIRTEKTYTSCEISKIKIIEDYVFYDIEKEETPPYQEHHLVFGRYENTDKLERDSNFQKEWIEEKNRWEPNFKIIEKEERIISYYYSLKVPVGPASYKTYVDGIIEEWTFPSPEITKNAAEDIAIKGRRVYFNRGAYVCYLGNYMYVFHSRSAGFYTPLKQFIEHFALKNGATIPFKDEQRKNY